MEEPQAEVELSPSQRRAVLELARLPKDVKESLDASGEGQSKIVWTQSQMERLYALVDRRLAREPSDKVLQDLAELQSLLYWKLRGIWLREQRAEREAAGLRPNRVLQFKITLDATCPIIWRRIQIEDCTLGELHDYLQVAFGWADWHLHEFFIEKVRYGPPLDEDLGTRNENEFWISDLLPTRRRKVRWLYVYDFGDEWTHVIEYEGEVKREEGQTYPLCVEGERAGPPEDVEGPWGFAELLHDLEDPDAEENPWQDELETFEPEEFDPQEVTLAMRKLVEDV